jgi:hypothetical protein
MDGILFLSFVGGFSVFDGKVETNDVSSMIFTIFVGGMGIPGILCHFVFGFSMIVNLQQLLYSNRQALLHVSFTFCLKYSFRALIPNHPGPTHC